MGVQIQGLQEHKMKDIINLLTTEKDVASGQHVPAGEAMWSYPSMADDKKKKNVEKDFVNELGNPIKIEIKEKIGRAHV